MADSNTKKIATPAQVVIDRISFVSSAALAA
jgi:hypothetical protein